MRSLRVGAVTVAIIDVGHFVRALSQWVSIPESERAADYDAVFNQPAHFALQCVALKTPAGVVLVDAGKHVADEASESSDDADLSGRLADGLRHVGIAPADVTHIVITHLHSDHYNALTHAAEGQPVLQFPNARVYVGRADWAALRASKDYPDPASLEQQTLGVVDRAGLLIPVDGDLRLVDGVSILAMPGETAGHQIVRVHSSGETLYCLGDLYHHEFEIASPQYTVTWADPAVTARSRAALVDAALADNAIIVATHIPRIGRLVRTARGLRLAR